MIDPQRYEPILFSEWLLSVLPGQPPLLGCGISTAAHGLLMGTAGEFGFLPDGSLKGKTARTRVLKRGWRAFTSVADSNGIPDTDDYLRIHRAMGPPDMPDPEQLWTRKHSDIVDALTDGFFISIAVRLSAVAGTAAARYTTADHQTGIWDLRDGTVSDIDPMHKHSYNAYHGHRVKLDDIITAARAIEGGLMLCWLYPIGGWTQEALVRKRKNRRIVQLEASAAKTEARLRQRIEELEATVPPDCADEITNARAAGRESAFVQVLQGVQAMRTEPED